MATPYIAVSTADFAMDVGDGDVDVLSLPKDDLLARVKVERAALAWITGFGGTAEK